MRKKERLFHAIFAENNQILMKKELSKSIYKILKGIRKREYNIDSTPVFE